MYIIIATEYCNLFNKCEKNIFYNYLEYLNIRLFTFSLRNKKIIRYSLQYAK